MVPLTDMELEEQVGVDGGVGGWRGRGEWPISFQLSRQVLNFRCMWRPSRPRQVLRQRRV